LRCIVAYPVHGAAAPRTRHDHLHPRPRKHPRRAAGIAITGAAYLVYTMIKEPKGTPQPPSETSRRYTETEYVEATGCGLVPAG